MEVRWNLPRFFLSRIPSRFRGEVLTKIDKRLRTMTGADQGMSQVGMCMKGNAGKTEPAEQPKPRPRG